MQPYITPHRTHFQAPMTAASMTFVVLLVVHLHLSGHSKHFLLRPPKAVQSVGGIAQKHPEAHKSAVSICSRSATT